MATTIPADWWPPLEAELVERLGLPLDEMARRVVDYLAFWPRGEADEAFVRRALDYPWARPAGSFVLEYRDALGPLTPAHRDELDALAHGHGAVAGAPRRYPLLAIGSNGAPDTLVRKFELLPVEDTRVLVVAGSLRDFDVGAAARLAPYGAFPATLVPSPGTHVACSVLWVTEAQLLALTWSELSYAFGALGPVTFTADVPSGTPRGPETNSTEPPVDDGSVGPTNRLATESTELYTLDRVLAYVSRWGHLTIDGAPVSLEPISAARRTGAVWSQERLLDHAAARALGAGASHRRLLEALAREPIATIHHASAALADFATPFSDPAWTAYPGTSPPA